MIISFRHKGLKLFYETGKTSGINPQHAKKLQLLLARLEASAAPNDMNLPGLRFHGLSGDLAGFYAVTVSANWRLVFRFEEGDAADVDLVDYH